MTQENVVNIVKTRKSLWERIAIIYQTIALMSFNTLVFLVVAVLFINLLVPAKNDVATNQNSDVVAIGVNAVYSNYFNHYAYYLSSPDEVSATLADYDAMARAGHWMVHPWTGLTMRPFKSHYLNIDANGFRIGVPVDRGYDGKPPLVIWGFGGSTLFGWGLADEYSIPSLLQVELQKRLPDRQVKVVNLAVPIYNSSQELALFTANLRESKPDIAFFFDGVNDLWYTLYQNTQTPLVEPLAAAWEKNTYGITHPQPENWFTVNASFPPLRLAEKFGIAVTTQPGYYIQYAMRGIYRPTYDELVGATVHNYAANRQMADAIGSALGVKTFFFLQPYTKDKVDFPKFRAQLEQQTTMSNYYDISHLLDGELIDKRKSLIDDFHYSDFASGIIAARLADILLQDVNVK
jgi:hypothetical protein